MPRLALVSYLLLALAACLPSGAAPAADTTAAQAASGGLRPTRLALLGATGAAAHYVGFRYFDRAWYQGQRLDHIRWVRDWDGDTYLNLDKGGHFMGGLFVAQTLTDGYAWSGFGPRLAALLGTVTGWGALLEIEMRDAYFDQWGFSIPDFTANTAGAAVPLVYALVPASRAVRFKFGYHPSRLYLDRAGRRAAAARYPNEAARRAAESPQPYTDYLIDDYEGMSFWASLALDPFLPIRLRPMWPDGLGLAVGYGATGMHGSNRKSKGREKYYHQLPAARPEVFVGLDYDARFLPGQARWWRYVKSQLNWLRLPAPAVRVYPGWRFYLLYA